MACNTLYGYSNATWHLKTQQILLIHMSCTNPSRHLPSCSACVIHIQLRRQEWVVPGLHTFAPSLILTPEQRRRRSLYFQPPPTESTANRLKRTSVVSSAEVQMWITRELQAITLEEDVKLLCQVVLGCLAAVAQSLHNPGKRYCALACCICVSHCLCPMCKSIGADKEGTRGKQSQPLR